MRHLKKEEFETIVKSNISIAGFLKQLGMSVTTGNYNTFKRYVKKLGIDTSHFKGQAHGKTKTPTKRSLEEILIKNSDYSNQNLKKRLLKEKKIKYKCKECLRSAWRGKPLVLQLDHINGINTDNRLGNLRLLCPNCHSQTETFAGKNKKDKNKSKPTRYYSSCKICKDPTAKSNICASCYIPPKKIFWPSDTDLLQMLEMSNYSKVAEKLGVSDNAIRKRLKIKGLL